MSYVLINRTEQGTPTVIREYKTQAGALVGMRAANKNAGWTRITRAMVGLCHLEWCARTNGLPVYDYAPYVVMHRHNYDQRYGMHELVPVKNLMSGETVLIHRKDRGTCVDPSMERYWSQ